MEHLNILCSTPDCDRFVKRMVELDEHQRYIFASIKSDPRGEEVRVYSPEVTICHASLSTPELLLIAEAIKKEAMRKYR